MLFLNGIFQGHPVVEHENYPAMLYLLYRAFAFPKISKHRSEIRHQSVSHFLKKKTIKKDVIRLTSSHTKFLLLAPGRRFIIFNSADLRSPSAVNSMFGLFKSPSIDTFLKYLKNLDRKLERIIRFYVLFFFFFL